MPKRRPRGPVPHGTNNGYSNYGCRCDECRAAMSEYQRRYYAANAEKVKARVAAWIEAGNKVNRDPAKVRATARRSYEAHRVDRIRNAAAWQRANPEKARAKRARYKKRNPEKDLAHVERRRARKAGADTREFTEREWSRLVNRYRGCAYCESTGPVTQDHVIPIARGGRHSIGNLLPACVRCNSSKGSKLLIEWRAQRKRVAA